MLIINADDYGLDRAATDHILRCIDNGVITAVGAMVFMSDSRKAAALANSRKIEVGLHLNLTQMYSEPTIPTKLRTNFERVANFLKKSKYAFIFYHPFLYESFEYLVKAQLNEFQTLFNKPPAFINGHHHMHLASNLIFSEIFAAGTFIRRNHSFDKKEKNLFNRTYRKYIDKQLCRKFQTTDYFFDIRPLSESIRLTRIVDLSRSKNVELMVHPSNDGEMEFLLSSEFISITRDTVLSNFSAIKH